MDTAHHDDVRIFVHGTDRTDGRWTIHMRHHHIEYNDLYFRLVRGINAERFRAIRCGNDLVVIILQSRFGDISDHFFIVHQ